MGERATEKPGVKVSESADQVPEPRNMVQPETPRSVEDIAQEIVTRGLNSKSMYLALEGLIAAALRAEREARERAEQKVADLLPGAGEPFPHCSNCGVVLNCNGSQREHEWVWYQRATKSEQRVRVLEEALRLQMSSHDIGHSPCYCIESRRALAPAQEAK